MSETRDKTCEERIEEHLTTTIEAFKKALDGDFGDENEYEDFIEWLDCYILAYADDPHYRAKKLELSWGGPADYFLFFEDETIEYHFQDWFDGAKRELDGEDYDIMKSVYDMYLNYD